MAAWAWETWTAGVTTKMDPKTGMLWGPGLPGAEVHDGIMNAWGFCGHEDVDGGGGAITCTTGRVS